MDDDGKAFLEVTLPHLEVVSRVARYSVRDVHLAEDLVQETYLRAFAAFDQRRTDNTRAWLITICLNLVRSEARRRSRRVVETELTALNEPESGAIGVPEEALARLDRETVARALARLSDEQRLAIVLMDLATLSASEVAEVLGCSRNTVLSRAHRGRKRLAELLTEEVRRDVS